MGNTIVWCCPALSTKRKSRVLWYYWETRILDLLLLWATRPNLERLPEQECMLFFGNERVHGPQNAIMLTIWCIMTTLEHFEGPRPSHSCRKAYPLACLFPANPTQQWGIQGLRCGARRPFLPVVAMVEMDVVGYLWWELTSACICSRNTTQFLQNRGQNFFCLKVEVMPGHAFYILGYRSYTVFRHGFDWPKSCLNRLDEF